jgi:hypothetical protein
LAIIHSVICPRSDSGAFRDEHVDERGNEVDAQHDREAERSREDLLAGGDVRLANVLARELKMLDPRGWDE